MLWILVFFRLGSERKTYLFPGPAPSARLSATALFSPFSWVLISERAAAFADL